LSLCFTPGALDCFSLPADLFLGAALSFFLRQPASTLGCERASFVLRTTARFLFGQAAGLFFGAPALGRFRA
jgi:hypothetical protein